MKSRPMTATEVSMHATALKISYGKYVCQYYPKTTCPVGKFDPTTKPIKIRP